MTPPLFWLEQLPEGDLAVLDGEEGRHAARVKRLAVGEAIWLGDGVGTVLEAVVHAVERDRVECEVLGRLVEVAPDPRIVVVQAIPKSDRADLAIELLTELGADEIIPWAAARSIGQWRERSLIKWRRTASEAAKQSRRAWRPVVTDIWSTASVATRIAAASAAFTLHESAGAPLVCPTVTGEVVVVVGPEGGLTEGELSTLGASAVRLGSPVLRTSTAGAAALAALSVQLGRWA